MKVVTVGGLETAVITLDQMAHRMAIDCKGRPIDSLPKLVFSSNGQGVSLAAKDERFLSAMKSADIIHADGMSVVTASRIFSKTSLPERCATTDFFHNAAREAIRDNLSFYILGGKEEQNKRAVDEMLRLYPGLRIVGRRDGYFDSSNDEEVCADIVSKGTDVLWVALGKPKQEFWCVKNRERLRGVGWVKTCGGLYGYLAGDEKRAPKFLQSIGAEWLWRTALDPRRLGWRYLVTNPHAMWQLFVKTSR